MQTIGDMPVLFLLVFRFVRLLLSGHQAVAIENAALRMQIAAFQRKRKRPLLTTLDRVFWITLRSLWSNIALIYIQADTVVRWHRERFGNFWARLSNRQRRRRGRPGTAAELRPSLPGNFGRSFDTSSVTFASCAISVLLNEKGQQH